MDFDDFCRQLEEVRGDGPENIVCLARVGSTNAVARKIAREYLDEGLASPRVLVVAYEQTGGRGRMGRRWTSPPGQGIYATLVTSVGGRGRLETLPLLAAVGLARALGRHLPGCRLKWPNDLMIERRKIGGILIETLGGGEATVTAIGFGINHGQKRGDLPDAATSLALERSDPPPLGRLARDLLEGLDQELAHLGDAAYAVARYEELSLHGPGDPLCCRMAGETVEGTFLGFTPQGFLRLETAQGERRIAAAEVIER